MNKREKQLGLVSDNNLPIKRKKRKKRLLKKI